MTEQEVDDKSTSGIIPVTDNHKSNTGGKIKYYEGNVAVRLVISQRDINFLQTDEATQNRMRPLGYTVEKIARFAAIHDEASKSHSNQQIERAERSGSYNDFEKFFAIAKSELSCVIKIAKIALKNDMTRSGKLNLSGAKGNNIAEVFTYMQRFYDAIFLERSMILMLSPYGYDEARVKDCFNAYIKARDTYSIFISEYEESKEATRIRDEKMDVLNEWMYDYYSLEKVSLQQLPSSNVAQ